MNILELMNETEIEKEVATIDFPHVISEDEADETLARILWAESKIKENEKIVKEKKEELMNMLVNYEKRLNDNLRNYAANQRNNLNLFLREKLRDKDGNINTGTVKLFHGNIRLKKPSESMGIDDEERAIAWLKENGYGATLKNKVTISKTEAKKLFKKDEFGQYYVDKNNNIIPGIHVELSSNDLELAITPNKSIPIDTLNIA